ncbi:hypothetical protein AXF19_04290 [Selenomonas sp. oral taxon 126]|nr:hypothetical protein AXF19_04290 [Selenomonas sp. oral taxon 126]
MLRNGDGERQEEGRRKIAENRLPAEQIRICRPSAAGVERRLNGGARGAHALVQDADELRARLSERRFLHRQGIGGTQRGICRQQCAQLRVDRADGSLGCRTRTDARETLRPRTVGDGEDGDVPHVHSGKPVVAVRPVMLVLLAAHARRNHIRRADPHLLCHVLGGGIGRVGGHGAVLPECRRMRQQLLVAEARRLCIRRARILLRGGGSLRSTLRRRGTRLCSLHGIGRQYLHLCLSPLPCCGQRARRGRLLFLRLLYGGALRRLCRLLHHLGRDALRCPCCVLCRLRYSVHRLLR